MIMIVKRLLVILFVIALIPFTIKADWVSLNNSKTSNTPPNVTLLSHDDNSSVIKIDISGFESKEFMSEGKSYQSIDLLTEIFSNEPGYPNVPGISKVLAIPDQAAVSVEVIETGDIQTIENILLPPARLSWYEGEEESPYVEKAEVYQSDNFYPQDYVSVDPPSIFRDFRIARISVYPFRYSPAKKELEVVSSITVKVNYVEGEVINPKTKTKSAIAPSFGKLYRSFIFNYQEVLDNLYGGKEEGHEVMLCIMDDLFEESFQVYADWKRQSGTDTHVTLFSDIGANSSNPTIIKDHITDAYYNWDIPPTYVLIVGDDGVFPKKIVTYDYSFPNEDYFVEIEGDDHFPEMMIGRFTNQGDYRMQVMINKFMMYEKTPYVEDTDWFKKATVCSNNAYASQVQTKRYAAQLLSEDGGFTSVDTLMSDGNGWGYGCTVDLGDVISTLNDGRSFLNYRGEGWSSGWSASCYSFNTSDVTNLNNGEKFTFVTSIGCGVAMFDTYGGNCFGEEWVQLGSLTDPRGGVAFVGPTSNTHTTYNNKIDKGIYTGLFWEGMDTPGQALLRGKLYMYNVYGSDFWVEYHYRVYCILGDPSLHVWMDVPLEVNVDHPTSVMVGINTLDITTVFDSGGEPVANAEVCLTGDDLFMTAISDTEGNVFFEIEEEEPQTLVLTVRGGNVYPYQGTIEIVQPMELVGLDNDPEIVDLDGNTDGLVNPNENCNVTYTLKNWGTIVANNVEASISTSNPEFIEIITTSSVSFGTLSPGESATGDPFQIFVKPECPVGQEITLQLSVTSTSSSWVYNYTGIVTGCVLDYKNFVVNDAGLGNGNYRMDPGETLNIAFSIENIGEDIAPNVKGELMCNDPYITIEDLMGNFGTIEINNLSISEVDHFILTVDESCPTEYMVDFLLKLYTENGNYPYEIITDIELPVSLPISTDYSGPDDYGYYAYSSDDSFYEQTPEYNWVEIVDVGTQINIPNVSDYTETVDLPFTFKYYGINYNHVRVSTDGWIAMGGGDQIAPDNTGLPNGDDIISMIAVFWDDLYDLALAEGKIIHYNDAANHRFIVEWDSISHNLNSGEPKNEVFQVILLDPEYYPTATGDGEIIVQYKQVENPSSMTMGIENHAQNTGIQYLFDEDYDPTATLIMNEYAVKYTTEPPFISIITAVDPTMVSAGNLLEQNIPNPFRTSTWIKYTLAEQSNVSLNVYSINGELISQLHQGQQPAGKYSIEWNGVDGTGKRVNSGIYFYRIKTDSFVETKKMFLLD